MLTIVPKRTSGSVCCGKKTSNPYAGIIRIRCYGYNLSPDKRPSTPTALRPYLCNVKCKVTAKSFASKSVATIFPRFWFYLTLPLHTFWGWLTSR